MKGWARILAVIAAGAAGALAAPSQQLTTLSAITAISNAEAERHMPVSFEATVTYARSYQTSLFVQDGDSSIYVSGGAELNLVPGDLVLVNGTMHESFRPYVLATSIKQIGHGPLPAPLHPTFREMVRAETDCKLVTVQGVIQSADLSFNPNFVKTTTSMRMLVDGAPVEVTLDNEDPGVLKGLLDAEVEITGVVSGVFDNKMQQTGVFLHVQSMADVKILKRASVDPWSLPVTPMDRILTGYQIGDLSQRMHLHGTVTFYEPNVALVLQDGLKSMWITTNSAQPLQIGDLADVIGFPDVQNGFLTLINGEMKDSAVQSPIVPRLFTWRELAGGGNAGRGHNFDLVSIDGQVVAEVRQATQDEYVLAADGHLFSAILRHPGSVSRVPLPVMKQIPIGAHIRVTGICMLADANPFNGDVPFNILMRSYDDIALVASPPWLNVPHLILLVSLLLVGFIVVGTRSWFIERKMRRQTSNLAYLEQRRSRILEAMNALRPLAEILEDITELVSFNLSGAACWCQTADGATLGNRPPELSSSADAIMESAITAPTGSALGKLNAAICGGPALRARARKVLSMASGLAALAIETSRLHSDLVHRSEFDQLTDIQNRFSLEKYFEKLIETARQSAGVFGLLYIDLDGFKQVNDVYGHRTGDLYLQEVALRMKRQLRPGDFLARLGGDEFAVLVAHVRGRADMEEIASRLRACFDKPFAGEGCEIYGSASIGIAMYPEDGASKDSLLSSADAAMYVAKQTRLHGHGVNQAELVRKEDR